jgi:hypothetical protein
MKNLNQCTTQELKNELNSLFPGKTQERWEQDGVFHHFPYSKDFKDISFSFTGIDSTFDWSGCMIEVHERISESESEIIQEFEPKNINELKEIVQKLIKSQ